MGNYLIPVGVLLGLEIKIKQCQNPIEKQNLVNELANLKALLLRYSTQITYE